MKTIHAQFCDEQNETPEAVRPGRAVIVYDHVESLLAAKQLLGRLASNGQPRIEWLVNSWRFDMLRIGSCLEARRALEETTGTTLVVVAIHDPASWTKLPETWLRLWTDIRRSPTPQLIVMTLDRARKSAEFAPSIELLRRLAEDRAVAFSLFCRAASDGNAAGDFRRAGNATQSTTETMPCPIG